MRKDPTIPLYLLTGFLDGGKTNFLKFTMEQEYFNDGSKTLLIVCEEGEEEYTKDFLKKTHAQMVTVENEEDLTPELFESLQKQYKPDRVLLEYNGMWNPATIVSMPFPKNWTIYQVITILDGENFKLFLNNIKMAAMNLLTNTDMVIFNRCGNEEDMIQYQRAVRSVNSRCEIVFEGKDGKELECPEPDLPYDIDQPEILITDETYPTLYIDMSEHPERYVDKVITMPVQVMQQKSFPKNLFVGGRRAMTCCAEDVRFLPYIFIYEKARSLKHEDWISVKAVCKWEFHEGYQEEGPVFYVQEVKLTNPPADELVYF